MPRRHRWRERRAGRRLAEPRPVSLSDWFPNAAAANLAGAPAEENKVADAAEDDVPVNASLVARKPLLEIGSRLLSSMTEALRTHGVVPDVVDKVPASTLKVTYPNDVSIEIGKTMTPTMVKDPPSVAWDAEANAFYVLCMTDPDAPSRAEPKFREWHHWLVGNIPGADLSRGEVLSDYVGSGPPKGTGLHRYVFLLYKQPGKLDFDEPRLTNRSADGRANFSIRKFAAKYKLGDPIAGNMYQAEFDDYVPLLYKQLGA